MRDAFQRTRLLACGTHAPTVAMTVAAAVLAEWAPQARIAAGADPGGLAGQGGVLRIGLPGDGLVAGPPSPPANREWTWLRLDPRGGGEISASRPHLLWALWRRMAEDWADRPVAAFADGRLDAVAFPWLTARDELLTGRLGFLRRRRQRVQLDDVEAAFRELARMGGSHVVVNELAQPLVPSETGPDGEIYYRFYAYLPDLDQYVESKLNEGTYPLEHLQANLNGLRAQARLADRYGLTPGLAVANPRSVPESLLARYPYLRGARVDHTFRSYRPRYTLTLAHPAVRWHYAELMRSLLRAVPELGFVTTLLNDSGSGFEYTHSLYPGRNGGPYMVREWLSHEEIARTAAESIVRYYHVLRDAAREVRPDFRVVVGLKNIAEEAELVLEGLEDGIDRQTVSQRHDADKSHWQQTREEFEARGSYLFASEAARGSEFILGVPAPWRTRERLEAQLGDGFDRLDVNLDSPVLAPWDVNREVLRGLQLDPQKTADEVVSAAARRWVGEELAPQLVSIWRRSDAAVRAAPTAYLYGTLGFPWYRFWVRPFVPDIAAIPEGERAYYEKHMLCVFNNPHFVDFRADALWEIHSIEDSRANAERFDGEVWQPLDQAIDAAGREARAAAGSPAGEVFADLRDRLRAYRCYSRTLRNMFTWIASVPGYLEAADEAERARKLEQVRRMVADELANAEDLLQLWEESDVDFMPVHEAGESMHHYGVTFGDLVRRKIELMRQYGDRPPRIDPDFMWRMPPGAPIDASEYLGY
ncbi:MAG: hypothetical protein ABIL09_01755 [Gemmatimonadota bacterium]